MIECMQERQHTLNKIGFGRKTPQRYNITHPSIHDDKVAVMTESP